jgi:hypothetical protein
MPNILPDPLLIFSFIALVLVGAGVYFAEAYRQLIVKDRRIGRMSKLVDTLMSDYEKNIACMLDFLLKRLTQDPGVLATLEAQKVELRSPEQKHARKFQRLRAVSRRLFDVLAAHPDLKDSDALNIQKTIYDTEDDLSIVAQNHDSFVETFNLRLLQFPEKWFAQKFNISPHSTVWADSLKKHTI